ncbi:MAG: hypothetical protein NZ903_02005 [Candidatus Micrarchaeota archaeon]|nr:hypothetical protein [Candidatus Micrarchaeota archaeon]
MKLETSKVAKIGVFAALYAVLSLIPISVFIGAPSFLTLNLIITPVIAMLLDPFEALLSSLFGGIIAYYIAPSQAMFGPLTILLPIVGSTFGSLAFHKGKKGGFAAACFLLIAMSSYLVKNFPFPYFVTPHLIATVLALVAAFKRMTPTSLRAPLFAFVSTMCEQGMMMIFAVHLLGLPWQAFVGIFPLMVYERLVGTIGATLLTMSLMRIASKYLFVRIK